jgi:hypothetical protein
MFPSLTPSARSWTPGQPVASAFVSSSGYEVRVLQGAASVGQQLSLVFSNLLEAKGKEITDHYEAMRGTFGLFDLPAEVYGELRAHQAKRQQLAIRRPSERDLCGAGHRIGLGGAGGGAPLA